MIDPLADELTAFGLRLLKKVETPTEDGAQPVATMGEQIALLSAMTRLAAMRQKGTKDDERSPGDGIDKYRGLFAPAAPPDAGRVGAADGTAAAPRARRGARAPGSGSQ